MDSRSREQPILKGADRWIHSLVGRWHRRRGLLRHYLREAAELSKREDEFSGLRESALKEKLREMKSLFRRRGEVDSHVRSEALGLLREAARRVLHLSPYPTQLVGAMVIDDGCLAEMATGEGKTLTSGLAAVLAGWRGKPVHVITVNDYLVKRDREWLERFYQYCGLRARWVVEGMPDEERRAAYDSPIVYGTSKELAADYLRDRLRLMGKESGGIGQRMREYSYGRTNHGAKRIPVMRGLYRAIVDEADSLLIDEAVTPLILSRKVPNLELRDLLSRASQIAGNLDKNVHYRVETRYREVHLTESGKRLIEPYGKELGGIWGAPARREEIVSQVLEAKEFYRDGEQYIVSNGKVVIVDEFTGRPMPDRSWKQGLHQAVEIKEGVEMTDPTETLGRISFQRYFRKYEHLSGMTGTAAEVAGELWSVYNLPVIPVPTHRPCIRKRLKDRYYETEEEKLKAMAVEVGELHRKGVPVLVGTRTVATSERLGAILRQQGLKPMILNATQVDEEANIVALAGLPGKITIATNMAGRGTDIRLGEDVADRGGLHVLSAERHESGRVDRQLYGRAGRQGDPGVVRQYASAEDLLAKKYLSSVARRRLELALRGKAGTDSRFGRRLLRRGQIRAQKQFARQRRRTLEQDERLDEGLAFGRVN